MPLIKRLISDFTGIHCKNAASAKFDLITLMIESPPSFRIESLNSATSFFVHILAGVTRKMKFNPITVHLIIINTT